MEYNLPMPRQSRLIALGECHHITQRGNGKQIVFHDDKDKEKYLEYLLQYSKEYELSILVYSLMPNHVHHIVVPAKQDSIAKTFKYTHGAYAQYYNKKHERSGHLWQGRFYSCILDPEHLYCAVRYIERNPVRAGLVQKPWDWNFSSVSAHLGKIKEEPFGLRKIFGFMDILPEEWKFYIDSAEDEKDVELFKKHTKTGRPLGEKKFIDKLEKRFNISLVTRAKGRPGKKKKKNEDPKRTPQRHFSDKKCSSKSF
ncbi:MAG: transposase [Candidatus Omnitrophica bacterium]|nr:transposase [Candidatus Omnitrophota bacterium]